MVKKLQKSNPFVAISDDNSLKQLLGWGEKNQKLPLSSPEDHEWLHLPIYDTDLPAIQNCKWIILSGR